MASKKACSANLNARVQLGTHSKRIEVTSQSCPLTSMYVHTPTHHIQTGTHNNNNNKQQ